MRFPSIVKADRLQDLMAAGTADVGAAYGREQAMGAMLSDTEGRHFLDNAVDTTARRAAA
ncbi:hypothetical protein [Arthrobacter antioxidans]|uniref:hypothetical protein n=1 Tax=Arthrobacter antioxidans TaxID=2895818 RepID=UPI001FFEC663|nr:hypothetical protein [Arthrobacter antioxidans]